jgi:hypothetical protein
MKIRLLVSLYSPFPFKQELVTNFFFPDPDQQVCLCRIISLFRYFGGSYCFHLQGDWTVFRWMLKWWEADMGVCVLPTCWKKTYDPARFNNPEDCLSSNTVKAQKLFRESVNLLLYNWANRVWLVLSPALWVRHWAGCSVVTTDIILQNLWKFLIYPT